MAISLLSKEVPGISCKSVKCQNTFSLARGDFTQQFPIPFDAQSPENFLAEATKMSEFSCVILGISSTVVIAMNALITPLTAMEICPICARSHCIEASPFQPGSVIVQQILFLLLDVEDCSYAACQGTIPLLAPMTMSMDSSIVGNTLLDNLTIVSQFPRDKTSAKESKIGTFFLLLLFFIDVSFPEFCCFILIKMETKQ